MGTEPTTPLAQPVSRRAGRGILRLEVLIILIGLATIGAFVVSTSTMTNRLRALKAQAEANHVLQVKVSISNVRLEQALSGRAQVLSGASAGALFPDRQGARQPGAVDIDQEIHGSLADAAELCRARLDGGPTPIGFVPAASGPLVRANLAALCREITRLRGLTNARLAQGTNLGAAADVVQEYERRFRQILRLAEEDSRALDDLSARDEKIRRRTTQLTTGALLCLFVGLAVVVRRNRRVVTRKNVELSQLASIVDCANDAVFSLDLGGTILSWNRGAERLYGYHPKEAIGLSVLQLIHEPLRAEERMILSAAAVGTTFDGYDSTNVKKDGTPVDVSLTISPLRDVSGSVAGAAVISRDVSARKRVERAQAEAREAAVEASRLKSEFLANMSHEIRTPINGVQGLVELLLDTELDPGQRRYAEGAREAAGALLRIINDILDFSKIEAGKVEIEEVDVDLQVLVESVADLLAVPAHAKGLELACRYDPDLPSAVRGDPSRLRQVLVNLTGNAVKFTAEGEVVLRAERIDEDGESVLVRFEVRDSGPGIAPADHARLFGAFSQADASTTRRFGGTGLGLAVSKQLVELMGGEIGVESEVSRGSTFWFTVRLVKQRSDQAEARPLPPFRGVQVLVVDDNATQRLILDQCLTRWGMCPVLAEDGRQALGLAAAGSGPFQLAIVDFQMPGMNGLDLARHLSGGDTGRDLPVILLAAAGEVDPVLAGDAGIAVTVMKPVRQSDLHDAIVTVLAPTSGVPVREPALMTPPPAVHEDGGVPVLVAEDNALNQMVATGLLKALGYHPDVAGNGLEALEALERRDYALVLMDCQMPEMDGYQATAEIRRREAGGRRVPIIAMTANAMAGDREACLAAGMDDYISKPIERRALAELLDRWRKVTAVPEDDATVLDPAAHERMVENFGDDAPAVLDGLIGVFFQDAPELIATLRAATEAGTVADVRLPAHTLKSNAATLGATALAALCQQAESLSAAGSLEGLPRLVAEIESEYERVKGALQALQRSLARG